jgi:replicative DNA helicase
VARDTETPENRFAEHALVGAILRDNAALDEVAPLVGPEDFHTARARKVAIGIWEMGEAGTPIDAATVQVALTRLGVWDQVGGHDFLAKCYDACPDPKNAAEYAKSIRENAVKRRLIEFGHGVVTDASDPKADLSKLLQDAEAGMLAIADGRGAVETVTVGSQLDAVWRQYEAKKEGECLGLATGFRDVDTLIGGFGPEDLVILAGRPSMGKSTLALNIIEHVALDLGLPVLMISLEMSKSMLAQRLLVARAKVDGYRFQMGHKYPAGDEERLYRASGELSTAKIDIDDGQSDTSYQIAALARRKKRKGGLALLVVDYLQLVEGSEDRDNRQEQVAKISRRLKKLARELQVPVLALSQLNRSSEAREDKRPRMGDLRESGAIEQDADMVLLLHRPEYYDPNDQPGLAELIVAKNRNGKTDTVKLSFVKDQVRFSDLSESIPPAGAVDKPF